MIIPGTQYLLFRLAGDALPCIVTCKLLLFSLSMADLGIVFAWGAHDLAGRLTAVQQTKAQGIGIGQLVE